MSQKRPAAGGESRKRDSFLACALQRTPCGYERRIYDVKPTEQRKRGYERRIYDEIPTEQRKRGYERRIYDVIPTEPRKRGYERRIYDEIPTEQRKRGYERRIGIVIPMNAENVWIWQVETNVNLKKAGIL